MTDNDFRVRLIAVGDLQLGDSATCVGFGFRSRVSDQGLGDALERFPSPTALVSRALRSVRSLRFSTLPTREVLPGAPVPTPGLRHGVVQILRSSRSIVNPVFPVPAAKVPGK